MTTANKLTILRVLLIPLFIWLLYSSFYGSGIIAAIIFIVASLTDAVDGYIARSRNQVTDFGKLMDPLADKLLVTSALICFVELGYLGAWITVIVIAREFIVTGIRSIAISNNQVIAASKLGKLKTISQIIAIIFILIDRGQGMFIIFGYNVVFLIIMLMLILTVWSGMDYIYKNRKLFYININ